MTGFMESLGGWIQEFILTVGYAGIVASMAIENIFPPIPSEFILPFGGALSARGEMSFWGIVAAGTVGSVIGAIVLYAVGYIAREAGVRRLVARYGRYVFVSENDLDRASAWFERYGEPIILIGRLIPIIRSIISIPAGYTRMHKGRFLLLTAIGTLLWNLFLTYFGRVLGENWKEISEFTGPYQDATLIVFAVAIVFAIVWRVYRRWRDRQS